MPQPLTAEYRVRLDIVVSGLTHKFRTYAQASPSILAPSGYFLWDRTGLATIDSQDAAQSIWTALRGIYGSIVAAPQFILENRSGTVWNPVATGALTGAGTDGSSFFDASQLTVSLRTDNFQRIRMVILEQDHTSSPQKKSSMTAFKSAWTTALGEAIDGTDADGNGYFQWARSLDNRMLQEASPFVSATYDLNDKIRRARGLQ